MRWTWIAGASILGAMAVCVGMISGCASMDQKASEVYKRESGRKLGPWKSVQQASEIHWPYAWAAVAAYGDSVDPKRKPLEVSDPSLEPHAFLRDRGWEPWTELPSIDPNRAEPVYPDASSAMRAVHLRAEVWSNATAKQVIVAFGGTAANSLPDWEANFRWFFGLFSDKKDEYDVLTDTFVKTFIDAYGNRARQPGGEWLRDAQIVSTGHSLGGGLAQRFAYSLLGGDGISQVKEVYAFDPSPVSGKRSSPYAVQVAKGLTIYRLYNRGETLASVRSILQLGNMGNKRNEGQVWIDIRYRDNWTWRTVLPSGTVHAHGMYDLACFMAKNLPPLTAPASAALTNNCLVGGGPVVPVD